MTINEIAAIANTVTERAYNHLTPKSGHFCSVPSSKGNDTYEIHVNIDFIPTDCPCGHFQKKLRLLNPDFTAYDQRICKHMKGVNYYFAHRPEYTGENITLAQLRNRVLNPLVKILRGGKFVTVTKYQLSEDEYRQQHLDMLLETAA